MKDQGPGVREKLYTFQEASEITGLSVITLRRYERDGRISSRRSPTGRAIRLTDESLAQCFPIKLEAIPPQKQARSKNAPVKRIAGSSGKNGGGAHDSGVPASQGVEPSSFVEGNPVTGSGGEGSGSAGSV